MVRDDAGSDRADVHSLLAAVDHRYLVTEPAESYYLHYDLAPKAGVETTLFVQSRGYYVEWLRGDWLKPRQTDYSFSLFDVEGAIAELVKSWARDRSMIEETFYKTRIQPLGTL